MSFSTTHYSATTALPPEAYSLITNERQWNQASLHVSQALDIKHQIPINDSPNYSVITRLLALFSALFSDKKAVRVICLLVLSDSGIPTFDWRGPKTLRGRRLLLRPHAKQTA